MVYGDDFRMKKKIINTLFVTSLIFYILFLLWNILFKYISPMELFSSGRYFSRSINLIPFNDILNGNYNELDIWGNVILFIPLGIYINMFFKYSKILRNIGKVICISLLFEVSQYIFAIGATDITDIITNMFGGIIGIGLYLIIKKVIKDNKKIKTFVAICSSLVMVPVAFLVIALFIYN